MRRLNFALFMATAACLTLCCGEDGAGPTPETSVWGIAFHLSGTAGITDLYFLGPDDGWACADETVYRYDGTDWSAFQDLAKLNPGWIFDLSSVCALAGGDLWLGGTAFYPGREAEAFHYNGSTWEFVDVPDCSSVSDIFFVSPNVGWIAGPDGIFRYDGTSWERQLENETWSLAFADKDLGWACGSLEGSDQLFRWDGSRWRQEGIITSPDDYLKTVVCTSRSDAWAVGYGSGYKYRRGIVWHYDGGAWGEVAATPNRYFCAADFLSPQYGWIAEEVSGRIWLYQGGKFTEYTLPGKLPDKLVNEVWVNGERDAWACTGAGTSSDAFILHFTGFE